MSYSHEDIWSAICKLRQKTHDTHKIVHVVDDEAKSHYARTLGMIDRLEQRIAILEVGGRDLDARPLPEETQIQILGDFILEEIPGGIVLGQTVCDAATKLLRRYRVALEGIAGVQYRPSTQWFPATNMSRIARDALEGKDND